MPSDVTADAPPHVAPSLPASSPAPALARPRRRGRGLARRKTAPRSGRRPPTGMGLSVAVSLVPGVALFTVFFLLPLGVLLVTALADWGGVTFRYVGLGNFKAILSDPVFWKAAKNTVLYCAISLFVELPLGIVVGLMLAQRRRGWRFFRAAMFIPVVISGAAYALIYALFFNARYGLLNDLLASVGLGGDHDFLYSTSTALPAVAATFVFVIGYNVILVMAEVAAIPRELFEAAELDGASLFQRQRHVTLPLLRNVIGTLVLLTLLANLAFFDVPYILTSGGPDNATLTLTIYAYRAYVNGAWGYANAVGAIIVVLGLIMIVGTRRLFRIGERAF